MASRSCNKRLTREYQTISQNPPEFIVAHPSESNILEWHYIITGPPNTPYHNGQYWGTLMFPPDYPFAPPTIRMHTPSGRFSPSARLCLSISDFHPKSFNPAWEVSTILIGLLSFMTSEEMTTGSVSGTEAERKWFAAKSKWWNSTGGGSWKEGSKQKDSKSKEQKGNVKAGDGGAKFRSEWEELDKENWKWIKENKVDPATGVAAPDSPNSTLCAPGMGLRRPSGSQAIAGAVVEGGRAVGEAGWLRRNRLLVVGGLIFTYVLVARLLGDGSAPTNGL